MDTSDVAKRSMSRFRGGYVRFRVSSAWTYEPEASESAESRAGREPDARADVIGPGFAVFVERFCTAATQSHKSHCVELRADEPELLTRPRFVAQFTRTQLVRCDHFASHNHKPKLICGYDRTG